MEGTGTGERMDLPELRQIAMAQLLVVGHTKSKVWNATILNTSECVSAWLVGSKGMHFERPSFAALWQRSTRLSSRSLSLRPWMHASRAPPACLRRSCSGA